MEDIVHFYINELPQSLQDSARALEALSKENASITRVRTDMATFINNVLTERAESYEEDPLPNAYALVERLLYRIDPIEQNKLHDVFTIGAHTLREHIKNVLCECMETIDDDTILDSLFDINESKEEYSSKDFASWNTFFAYEMPELSLHDKQDLFSLIGKASNAAEDAYEVDFSFWVHHIRDNPWKLDTAVWKNIWEYKDSFEDVYMLLMTEFDMYTPEKNTYEEDYEERMPWEQDPDFWKKG